MNWANWRDLIHELYQLRTYWSLVPSPTNKRPMIVTLEDTQPFPCKSADEWIKTGVQLGKKFPVGWFTVKRDKPLESFNDAFFTHSFRYSKIPFGELIAKFESVKPSHRNWTGIVVPGARIHMFFDLDGSVNMNGAPFDHEKIKPIFMRVLRSKFKADFGRELDTSDEQWFVTPPGQGDKYSAHYHVLSESFRDTTHQNRWIKYTLIPWIIQQGMEHGDLDCLALCQRAKVTATCKQEKIITIIDEAMYTNNHQFRLALNCKPGGPILVPEGKELSTTESLFRSAFCYALTGDEQNMLIWTDEQVEAQGFRGPANGKRSGATLAQKTLIAMPEIKEGDVSKRTRFQGDAKADYSWLAAIHLHWFDDYNQRQPTVFSIQRSSGGFPIVTFKPGHACITCTQRSGGEIRSHKSNHSYLTINSDCTAIWFCSTDTDCSNEPYRVPLTPQLEAQLERIAPLAVHRRKWSELEASGQITWEAPSIDDRESSEDSTPIEQSDRTAMEVDPPTVAPDASNEGKKVEVSIAPAQPDRGERAEPAQVSQTSVLGKRRERLFDHRSDLGFNPGWIAEIARPAKKTRPELISRQKGGRSW